MFLQQQHARDDSGAGNSQDCGAYNVGQVMRAKVHSGEPDQKRDWQTRKPDAPTRENQNTKKRRRGSNVTGGKCVVFGAEPVLNFFRSYRRTGATWCDLNAAPDYASNRERH